MSLVALRVSVAGGRRGMTGLLALIALAAARVAVSSENRAIPLGPYHSDGTAVFVSGLAAVPDTRILFAAGDDGLYRSEDAGAHWTSIFLDPIGLYTVAVDPLEPSTVYAGSTAGLFRSTDSGGVWTKILEDATSALAFDPSGALFAGTSGLGGYGDSALVLRSIDRGASWVSLLELSFNRIDALAVDPVSPENLYVGTSLALFRSGDGGASWSAVYDGWVGAVTSVAVHPRSNATVFASSTPEQGIPENPFPCTVSKSTDFGGTWADLFDPALDCGFSSVAIEPSGRHRIFANAAYTLYVSHDAGRTFSAISDLPILAAAYAFDSRRPEHFYVAGNGVFEIILEPEGRGIVPPASSPPPTRTLPSRPAR